MRDYAKISPRFWIGDTGRQIRSSGDDAIIIAAYLLTSPHANMIGLYYLPIPTLCHETGRSFEGASKALRSLSEGGFAHYDEGQEVVWVPEMARHQIGDTLKPGDNRIKAVVREAEQHRKSAYYMIFVEKYRAAFNLPEMAEHEAPSKPLARPFEGPSKPRAGAGAGAGAGKDDLSADAVSEPDDPAPVVPTVDDVARQLADPASPVNQPLLVAVPPPPPDPRAAQAREVFEHWRRVMGRSGRTEFDAKRRRAVEARLKGGYSVADLCRAIDGCAVTPWNNGTETGKRYDDLELICRDAAHVDRFITHAASPPPLKTGSTNPAVDAAFQPREDW